ncbi:hypothetical protein TNCV_4913601 [Trichonephila clavipes]|nr:hypothetical protein TNCV_4913601 [Trichonephila clavipes]
MITDIIINFVGYVFVTAVILPLTKHFIAVAKSIGLQTGRPGFDARCHQTPSEYTRSTFSLNQWVRSLVDLITSAWTGEYFPPLQSTCRNCGGGDRGRVAIYRSFGEFRRAKIVLSSVWCSRSTTGVPLAHATMNFVDLDLTTSDRWH